VEQKIVWSPRALADLRAIFEFIQRSNPLAAQRFCQRLIARAEGLAAHPRQGRVIPELAQPELRELIFPPYRIAYRIRSSDTIDLLTIWHSARGDLML
jgi:toxin ParE1/3/4